MLVPVVTENGFDYNKSNWLGICVGGEMYYPLSSQAEDASTKEIDALAGAIKQKLAEMGVRVRWPGAGTEPLEPLKNESERRLSRRNIRKVSRQESRQITTSSDVSILLFQNGLGKYAALFEEEGYGNVIKLKQLAEEQGEAWRMLLMRTKLNPAYAGELCKALGVTVTVPEVRGQEQPACMAVTTAENGGVQSIEIVEHSVEVVPTLIDTISRKKKKKKNVIDAVNKELRHSVSTDCDTTLTTGELELSFNQDDDGETQHISIHKGGLLVALRVTTRNFTTARVFPYRRKMALTVTGLVYCIKSHDAAGKEQLENIAKLGSNSEVAEIEIGRLVKKWRLPLMPAMIVVLSAEDWSTCHQQYLGASIHPYRSRYKSDTDILSSFRFHDTGTRLVPQYVKRAQVFTFVVFGRFSTDVVYRAHPDERIRTFIPIEMYDRVVFDAKRAEFVEIARLLCAESISVKNDEDEAGKLAMSSGISGEGVSLSGAASKTEQVHNAQRMDQQFRKPKNLTPKFQKEATYFYEFEQSWQTMVKGRTDATGAKTASYDCQFRYTSDQTKAASVKLGVEGIAGFKTGVEKEQHLNIDETVKVTFWE